MKRRLIVVSATILGLVMALGLVSAVRDLSATGISLGLEAVAENSFPSAAPVGPMRIPIDAAVQAADVVSSEVTGWVELHPAHNPVIIYQTFAMAYDSQRGYVVLFGLHGDDGDSLNDTWEWDGEDWFQRTPAHAPAPRSGHAMAYDEARGVTVLFGGAVASGAPVNDTWEWDGSDWVQRTPATIPGSRQGAAMTYDSSRQRVVMFGGSSGTLLSDTWEWDGTNWVQRFPSTVPPAWGPGMAYDSARNVAVMYLVESFVECSLVYTWEWDGDDWTQRFPVTAAPARSAPITFHSDTARIMIFGGYCGGLFDDTWEWDGINWTEWTGAISPAPRWKHSMAYDGNRRAVLLFGGAAGAGQDPVYDETWLYGPVRLSATPANRVIAPGEVATFTVSTEGMIVSYTLSTDSLPPDTQGDFYPSPVITPPGEAELVLTTSSSTPDGIYSASLTQQRYGLSVTVPLTLDIVTPDFWLTPVPSHWKLYPDTVITYQVALTRSATYAGPVTMTLTGLPAGVESTVVPNPAISDTTVDVMLSASSSVMTGTYGLVIEGTGNVLSGTLVVPITRTTPVSLAVLPHGINPIISPDSRALYQAQSTVYTVTLEASPKITQPVGLAVDGLGDTYIAVSPNPIPADGRAALVVTTSYETAIGTRAFTVTASSGGFTGTTQAELTVLPAAMTLTLEPPSRTVYRGQTASYQVSLAATPGFPYPAALSLGGLPAGTSYSIAPAQIPPGGSASLLVTTTASVPLGQHQLIVNAAAAGLTQTASTYLHVVVPAQEYHTHYVAPGGVYCGAIPCYPSVQEAMDAAHDGDVIKVATGHYTDVNSYGSLAQAVYVYRDVTIRGGYTTVDWTDSRPEVHPTILDAQGAGRVFYISAGISTTIGGLHIVGGDAEGLGGWTCSNPGEWDAGGGLYVISATATLEQNLISGNTAYAGGGIQLWQSNARLAGNSITSNTGCASKFCRLTTGPQL